MQERFDARFGDTHITAPTEGSWNQISNDVEKDYKPNFGINSRSSAEHPPDMPSSDSRSSIENDVGDTRHQESHRQNFTITIPLPWSSRKAHARTTSTANSTALSTGNKEEQPELSPRSFMSSPEPTPRSFVSSPDPNFKSYISTPNTIVESQATSPVVIYKPVSEKYKQELAEMASGINRLDSPPTLPPDRAQNTSPSNVTYKPASEDFVKELAEIGMGPSPAVPPKEKFARPRAPSKTTLIGLPPDPRPTPISLSPESYIIPGGLPPDPRPIPASYSSETRPALIGLPVQPRLGTARSSSCGPAADRTGTTRSASRGPAPTTRSASRGPAPDGFLTTRSASRGPTPGRSAGGSHGRSSSRDPTSARIPYRKPVSCSSDSSAGSGISISSGPPSHHPITKISSDGSNGYTTTTTANNLLFGSTAEKHHNGTLNSTTGYYAAVANDFRRIASDVEDSEHERRQKKEMMENTKKGKFKKEKVLQGPQEMVPDTDDLW